MGGGCGKNNSSIHHKTAKSSIREDSPQKTGCECPFSDKGWIYCPRHAMNKTRHLYGLCKTSQKYFELWEDCGDSTQECEKMKNAEKIEESRGLGDTIAKITKFTGIDKLVDGVSKATGKDCGCEERRDKLNERFPYKKTKGFFK